MKLFINVNLKDLEIDSEGYILPYVRDLLIETIYHGPHFVDEQLLDLYHEQITDDYEGDTTKADEALTILAPLKERMNGGEFGTEVIDFVQSFEGRTDLVKEVELIKDNHPYYTLLVTIEDEHVNPHQSEPSGDH